MLHLCCDPPLPWPAVKPLVRLAALAIAIVIATSACTAEQISLYLDSTRETRSVLTNAELARLRACESNDTYTIVSPSGAYRGAYQFNRTTWNGVASRHVPWLQGLDPAAAEPWWQDAMARALWSERGRQPWPICGKRV